MLTTADRTERLRELKQSAENLAGQVADGRAMTDDEMATMQGILDDIERTSTEIRLLDAAAGLEARLAKPVGRRTEPDDTDAADSAAKSPEPATDAPGRPRVDVLRNRGTWDWKHFGEFARAIHQASADGGYVDPRLRARMALSTYGTEYVGADGGFAVPPDFRAEIQQLVSGEDSLLRLCDQLFSSSNHFTVPKDMSAPWAASGGIQAYWGGEGTAQTQSKPSLQSETVPLDKLYCMVPITDELLEDAPALDSYLRRKAPDVMNFKLNLAIVQGTGVGQPTGVLNSACCVSVAKEGAQAADTIKFANIVKMWTRLYGPCRPKAVWLINQDIEYQLATMEFTGTNSSIPAYLPANGLAGSPYGTLLGRPVLPSQACETLGDLGDILLVDLSQYMLLQKTTGLRTDVSIHLWFDYDVAAFRFIWRVGGRPWWSSACSPRDGSSTVSPFVSLAERA